MDNIEQLLKKYDIDNEEPAKEKPQSQPRRSKPARAERVADSTPPPKLDDLPPIDIKIDPEQLSQIDLGSSGTLVELSIGQFGNRKQDKKAADSLAMSAKAKRTMINVSKTLVESQTLKEITSLSQAVRTSVHYALTVPWGDNGWRYLPTDNFTLYEEQMSMRESQFWSLVTQFGDEYEVLRENAKESLGEMFDPSSYPSKAKVLRKFYFRYNYIPVPSSGDFRIDIQKEAAENIVNQYKSFYQRQIEAAMTDRWEQARERIVWLIDRITVEDGKVKRLRESTLNDAIQMINLLDTFNLTGDPKLSRITEELRGALHNIDAETLRDNDAKRRATKKKLEDVLSSIPTLS